jgi:hypothetical protein
MPLTTFTHRLFVARAEAAANSTFSDNLATAGDFENKPTATIDILDPGFLDPTTEVNKNGIFRAISKANGIVLSFAGGDADDDAFTWKIFGWKNENGPAELIADGTGILGSQAVVKFPHNEVPVANQFWADTLVVSNNYWIKRVDATDIGSNSVGKIWFDTAGYRFFLIEIPTSVGDMSAFFGYW